MTRLGLVWSAEDISTAKAEVALTADTEIKVFDANMPEDAVIKIIAFAFANVVDAKAMSGYLELKSNTKSGPWRFPVGFGTGGAATLTVQNRGEIPVNIPVKKNENITVYMTMNEAGVSAFCGLEYEQGGGGLNTYGECNTAEDAAVSADTLTDFGPFTIPPGKGGRIKKILVSYGNVVDAKAASGYIGVTGTSIPKPLQFVVGGGSGGATNAGGFMDAVHVNVDIPVLDSDAITIKLYIAEAAVDAHCGIYWVSSG